MLDRKLFRPLSYISIIWMDVFKKIVDDLNREVVW